ncbi:hypothetical protein [Jiangella gansuensis]|nr:hypothetical protein [Jiangella gansuensis]
MDGDAVPGRDGGCDADWVGENLGEGESATVKFFSLDTYGE